jgi:hypothetical protein
LVAALAAAAGAAGQAAPESGKSTTADQRTGGTVCVLPNSAEPPSRISPGGEYNPATLTVRIDKRQPMPWPHKQPIKIENLSLDERHLVVLTSDGKRIKSFWFQFSDFKENKLCCTLTVIRACN